MRGGGGGAEEVVAVGVGLTKRVAVAEERRHAAIRPGEAGLLPYLGCDPVAGRIEQDRGAAGRGEVLDLRRRNAKGRRVAPEGRSDAGRPGRIGVAVIRAAVGIEVDQERGFRIADRVDPRIEHDRLHEAGSGTREELDPDLQHNRRSGVDDTEHLHRVAIDVVAESTESDEHLTRQVEDDVEIALRARRAADRGEWLIPLEGEYRRTGSQEHALQIVDTRSWIEIMPHAAEDAGDAGRHEPPLPAFPGIAPAIAGRGEIGHAVSLHRVDGLGDDAVLEHRLGEVDDVVDDDVGASLAG